jgi:hypothetical protein
MRRLDHGDQQRGPNRAAVGNLSQQLGRLLPAALRQEILSRLLTQHLGAIQLPVEQFGAPNK